MCWMGTCRSRRWQRMAALSHDTAFRFSHNSVNRRHLSAGEMTWSATAMSAKAHDSEVDFRE